MILAGLCMDSLRSRFRRNLSWELNSVEQLAANQRLPEPSRRLSENDPVKNYVTISPIHVFAAKILIRFHFYFSPNSRLNINVFAAIFVDEFYDLVFVIF